MRAGTERVVIVAGGIAVGCLAVGLFTALFPRDSYWAVFLLDYTGSSVFPYPFTIQNIMIVMLFWGLGELVSRALSAWRERAFLSERLLPEDDRAVLQAQDLGDIRVKVAGRFDAETGFLPYLIDLCILQFHASRSVDQTVSVLNSSLELISHRLDLRYSMIRYVVWVIPTMGFIGTVVGIALALTYMDPDHMDLKAITANLAVAFNTTIVALVESAVLVFLLHIVQKQEETSLNLAGHYCLKNLINRLYAG